MSGKVPPAQSAGWPDIPIAVASGRMEDAIAGEFKTLGVTSRLDKPFTEAQLAEALKNLLAPK